MADVISWCWRLTCWLAEVQLRQSAMEAVLVHLGQDTRQLLILWGLQMRSDRRAGHMHDNLQHQITSSTNSSSLNSLRILQSFARFELRLLLLRRVPTLPADLL